MAPLPLTLAARLLPIAVLASVGWSMTATSHAGTDREPAASPSPSAQAPLYAAPPDSCAAVPTGMVKELVPGAKQAGAELKLSDPERRRGCSWNALKGFDYRWLDVTFEIAKASDTGGVPKTAGQRAAEAYEKASAKSQPLEGLGDEAAITDEVTEEDGQQTRQAVVVVRRANALITVTYNGSDFGSGKAPGKAEVRDGAAEVAKAALESLGAPGSA
ncbi:hypothetical protein [Streptomyces sp. GC420]|uniref:hypothetical protein n=1 Tax=Streptomyces sp. GC420 TaxID=2697568 RepID=UPI001414E573|nr:hypothetical protein [Streptomyces sp. GC420]NBM20811.1 hypothetical protein [Streptomyces sp. GC420]